jgi:hypothetical protein
MSKKKWVGGLFDIDNARKRASEENDCVKRVKDQIEALQQFDLADMLVVKRSKFNGVGNASTSFCQDDLSRCMYS